jgi:hypothetical protein
MSISDAYQVLDRAPGPVVLLLKVLLQSACADNMQPSIYVPCPVMGWCETCRQSMHQFRLHTCKHRC